MRGEVKHGAGVEELPSQPCALAAALHGRVAGAAEGNLSSATRVALKPPPFKQRDFHRSGTGTFPDACFSCLSSERFCRVLLSVLLRNRCPCVASASQILKRHLQKCSLMAVDAKVKCS